MSWFHQNESKNVFYKVTYFLLEFLKNTELNFDVFYKGFAHFYSSVTLFEARDLKDKIQWLNMIRYERLYGL